jgi:hypothetical protein
MLTASNNKENTMKATVIKKRCPLAQVTQLVLVLFHWPAVEARILYFVSPPQNVQAGAAERDLAENDRRALSSSLCLVDLPQSTQHFNRGGWRIAFKVILELSSITNFEEYEVFCFL